MKDFWPFFKNKKITVMGLGLLGRGVGDAMFLAENGAKLTVTDLKTKKQLKESVKKLKKFENIKYVLGKHRLEDFRNCDMVLKAAGVPPDSPYIKEAEKNKISVEMSAALFAKLSGLPIIGVTGTRGKSTVTHLIAHILKLAGKKVVLGGNIRGVSNLELLKRSKRTEIAVLELDSWQLQGFGQDKISPHISVFTNFLTDHFNYYKNDLRRYFTDKSYIYKFQKKSDVLILGPKMKGLVKGDKSRTINASVGKIPKSWRIKLPGRHNLENIACAVEVAIVLKIKESIIKNAVESFKTIPGRLELVRVVGGIKIYNDNSSTTPDATIAALQAVGVENKRKVVLIIGGDNKFLDMSELLKEIPKWCSKVVLFREGGTDLIRDKVFNLKKRGIQVYEEEGLADTVKRAFRIARSRETILYSPAFASFGKYFKNEFDRGDQFNGLARKLK